MSNANPNAEGRARLDAALAATYGDGRNARCSWCGIELDLMLGPWQRDRVVPGGKYNLSNVLPTCVGCNGDRGNATDGYWHERHRLYGIDPNARSVPPEVWRPWLSARRERNGQELAERTRRRDRAREGN